MNKNNNHQEQSPNLKLKNQNQGKVIEEDLTLQISMTEPRKRRVTMVNQSLDIGLIKDKVQKLKSLNFDPLSNQPEAKT